MDFIETQRSTYVDLSDRYAILADLQSKKLWHQLTIALLEFVRDPRSDRGDNLIQLYERFISTFEGRISQLQFVLIITQIASQYYPTRPYSVTELDRAIQFLAKFLEKSTRLGKTAVLLLRLEISSLRIKKASIGGGGEYFSFSSSSSSTNTGSNAGSNVASSSSSSSMDTSSTGGLTSSSSSSSTSVDGLLDQVKVDVLTNDQVTFDALPDGEDPIVAGTFYRVLSEYYKVRGPAQRFYETALLYLGYANINSLSKDAQIAIATDIAMAALVGDGVYNFGEVNAQPVVASLQNTAYQWLFDLLVTFQNGNIVEFYNVIQKNQNTFNNQTALAGAYDKIVEKIKLLAFMELAARRSSTDRSIAFTDIAEETQVPNDQVELLIIRAISLGLIKGQIDEIDQVVNVSFIKPRVLDKTQIAVLKEKITDWCSKTNTALTFMEDHTKDVLS